MKSYNLCIIFLRSILKLKYASLSPCRQHLPNTRKVAHGGIRAESSDASTSALSASAANAGFGGAVLSVAAPASSPSSSFRLLQVRVHVEEQKRVGRFWRLAQRFSAKLCPLPCHCIPIFVAPASAASNFRSKHNARSQRSHKAAASSRGGEHCSTRQNDAAQSSLCVQKRKHLCNVTTTRPRRPPEGSCTTKKYPAQGASLPPRGLTDRVRVSLQYCRRRL